MNDTRPYLGATEVGAHIRTLADRLLDHLSRHGIERPLLIGIRTGGVWIAERLHALLAVQEPLGELDISFYRDDFSRIGINPEVRPSNLPFEVEGRHLVLVDDVLQSGRTIRAAMNELFDYGRPASITLVVLVEKNGRELPIRPDVVTIRVDLEPNQQIKLTGPEPLELLVGASKRQRNPEASP